MTDISLADPVMLAVVCLALALGGILKGATGAGMPVLAVPVLAAFFDVRLAVLVIVIPNFITNVQQLWRYRDEEHSRRLTVQMVAGGMVGAVLGTVALVSLPQVALTALMAVLILVYVAMRLARPDFRIPLDIGEKTAWIASGIGGVLQGSLGISAPAAVTFLNALKLPRGKFIFTISAFFASMCIPQMVVATAYGLITGQIIVLGLLAVLPLLVSVRLGDWIGKRMSPKVFDRAILLLLVVLAIKQIIGVVAELT